jgi:hypothetical protein
MRAIDELQKLGYTLTIDRNEIVVKHIGQGHPDPATVKPLLDDLRAHKQEAIAYLRQREQTPATDTQPRQGHPDPPAETPATRSKGEPPETPPDESQPLALAGADVAEVVKGRELLKAQGYFLMHSRALEEQIAVITTEADRGRVPGRFKGIPVYTLAEIRLLAEGVKAGDLQRVADLRLLHTAKKKMGGVILK